MFRKNRSGKSRPGEPLRIRIVEDDPHVLRVVRELLEAEKSVEFVVESIASSQELRDDLARSALRDELTGLYSRSYFVESVENEARRLRRYKRDLSCLMLDLDDFKLLNEGYGHLAGDTVLRQVAKVVQDSVRDGDVVARYGEDEFCALLVETPLDAALAVADRIRFEIAARPAVVEGQSLSVTVSIGVCAVNWRHDDQPETAFDRAASALSEAKAAGKNQVRAHSPVGEDDQREPGRQALDLGQQSDRELAESATD